MTYDIEHGSSRDPLLNRDHFFLPSINIGNPKHDIQLLDISSNKKWVAYVTHFNDSFPEGAPNDQSNSGAINIFITRRRFTAIDQETRYEELGFSGNIAPDDLRHCSLEITKHVKSDDGTHCRFLSISNDGRYVALSFYEEDSNHKRFKNPDCLIFDMDGGSPDPHKIKCQGRAVFLNEDNKYPLAIVSKNILEIYAEFPEIKTVTSMFDLSGFYTSGRRTCPTVSTQESCIKNASWANIYIRKFGTRDSNNINTVITFTRHIRHNTLITPFTGESIVRIWSILDEGARFCSFPAKNQHIMALSTGYTYAAAYVNNTRSINIYNVKSGLLVYRLKSREMSDAATFRVSHIRFCYDARYVAMSGLEGDSKVSFEVWCLEAERSIYRVTEIFVPNNIANLRRVEPFVTRELKKNRKCLKGYYTSYPHGRMTVMCTELKIDEDYDNSIPGNSIVNWIDNTSPLYKSEVEIENGLLNFNGLRCGHISTGNKKYLIRFGKHTVQLWNVSSERDKDDSITDDDVLLYIRAYKGPDYGLGYSFRETWEIRDFDSIRYIGGNLTGRLIVNIIMPNSSGNNMESYHTEEIFLPLEQQLPSPDYHQLESACQALHYLFTNDYNKPNHNLSTLRKQTNSIITLSMFHIDNNCTYFSTISGSRTLAMLASFEDGRKVIKSIVAKNVPISIFSYPRSQSEIDKNNPPKNDEENDEVFSSMPRGIDIDKSKVDASSELNMPMPGTKEAEIFYRSSTSKPPYKKRLNTTVIAFNENVLTVLIDELNYDWFKFLFNRIISDSGRVGPGCLSSLTDALLYLEEGRKHNLLLLSSAKLSYLEVDRIKLGVFKHEYYEILRDKARQKKHITDFDHLEAHATMEQIKMYEGYSLNLYHLREKFLQLSNLRVFMNDVVKFYNRYIPDDWNVVSINSTKEVERFAGICLVPITHLNSYGDLYENRSRHTNIKEKESENKGRKNESAFVRVALDENISDMFQQGDVVLELLLKYKWQRFGRSRFILICFIHVIYYVSYCTSVLFAPELYGLNLEEDIFLEHPGQIASITLMVICLVILIVQEARQFRRNKDKLSYFFSGYNWIDMCAFVLPIFTLIQLCNNWPQFVEVCSVATLILWTHAILRLRVISHFGITLEIIIQLSRRIAPVLLIMLLVILAFTQSYIVLLRLQPDEYFRDTFSGTFLGRNDSGTGDVTFEGDVEFSTSSDNGFSNWFTAFYNVWLFIYGVWDPIVDGDAGSSLMVMCMSVVFSLIAVLIFFNMVIAIMSSAIEEVDSCGKKVCHFTDVVSEIEVLWCFKEKYNLKNNPTCLYYLASKEAILEQKEKLEEETAKLAEKLKIDQLINLI
ncbi:hypothetical protein MFLAVUS_005632 [Mucor flavus]|uniref:Ion transport domain-containing protein n=1 Tax=Mucor flavus TaxID=439312 RepID=A0ABP9YZ95_9FUNG